MKDAKGRYISYGVEYNIDIYYNEDNEKFYITNAYSSNLIDSVDHLDVDRLGSEYIFVGYTHYHPGIGPTSLEFSHEYITIYGDIMGDIGVANYYKVSAHLINYKRETRSNYDYLNEKMEKIVRGN